MKDDKGKEINALEENKKCMKDDKGNMERTVKEINVRGEDNENMKEEKEGTKKLKES